MTNMLLLLSALLPLVSAHMNLISPMPLGYKGIPGIPENLKDYNYVAPMLGSGADFPCKGHLNLLNDKVAGAPQATWAAGTSQSWTLEGSATHNGGSCQVAISEDSGKTFKVVKSYIGGCPLVTGTTSNTFLVPKETKSGKQIFAWTWFNNVGNREMYMNCVAVTITGGGSGLAAYPEIFKANVGNSCTVPAGVNVDFPNPGKDVARSPSNPGTRPDSSWGTCSKPAAAGAASFISLPDVVDTPAAASSPSENFEPVVPVAPVVPAPAVPECKRSVRYTRSEPVVVPVAPACSCQCTGGGVPKLVGSCSA